MKHIFALCAYGDSPYLPTASPRSRRSRFPPRCCCAPLPPPTLWRAPPGKRAALLRQSPTPPTSAGDWNFALRQAREAGADYVTLCHQDDLYLPGYGAAFRRAAQADRRC